jgi:hypothetical protein
MKQILCLALLACSFHTLAFETDLCDHHLPIDHHQLNTPNGDIPAIVCQQGDDILVLTDEPVPKEHLLYGGVSLGMPYVGMGLTYSHLNNGKQNFHVSATLEGSLGSNGLSIQYGKHPFGNAVFYGGTVRGYRGLPGEGGFQLGPTIGLSGGSKRITGLISLNLLAGYDSRMARLTVAPELSMGLRIRLLKK